MRFSNRLYPARRASALTSRTVRQTFQPVAHSRMKTKTADKRERRVSHRDRRVIAAGELTDDEVALISTAEVPAELSRSGSPARQRRGGQIHLCLR